MDLSEAFRFPGLAFLPPQPRPGLPLPPLDVAAFVGFAERGPLDVPVALEDPNTYQKVFGGDLPLAQHAGGRVVYANLPRTVQAFFTNGGRRCYVVRVAGKQAEAARFRVPGLVGLTESGAPRLAALSAASAGAWGARLRLAARLAERALAASAFRWAQTASGETVLQVEAGVLRAERAPQAGDVLRLSLQDGSRWLAPIAGVERTELQGDVLAREHVARDAPLSAPLPPVTLHFKRFYRLWSRLESSPPPAVSQVELLTIDGADALVSAGPLEWDDGRHVLALHPDDTARLSAGDVLRVRLQGSPPPDGPGYLARIEQVRARQDGPHSPPEPAYEATLGELLQLAKEALPADRSASPPGSGSLQTVELLRMDVLLRLGDERLPAIADLSLNAAEGEPLPQARFWGEALALDSSLLTGGPARRRAVRPGTAPAGKQANPYHEAAEWLRQLTYDPYDVLPAPGDVDWRWITPRGFDATAALAGLLAPLGSHLGQSRAAVEAGERYDRVEEEPSLTYLPIGMAALLGEGDPAQYLPPESHRPGTDGLETLKAAPFFDPRLAPRGVPGAAGTGETHKTLLQTAFDLRYVQGRRLRGMHSLLFIDEVAMIGAPDAAHPGWDRGEPVPGPEPPKSEPPAPAADCPPRTEFAGCSYPPRIVAVEPHYGPLDRETPVIVRGEFASSDEPLRVHFGRRAAEGVTRKSSTELSVTTPTGIRPAPVDVRVEDDYGSDVLAGGYTYTLASSAPALPLVEAPSLLEAVDNAPLLVVQQALSILCQARGDMVALLSLPVDYDTARCLEWQSALRRRLGLPALQSIYTFDNPTEIADLSFLAVCHPWVLTREPVAASGMRSVPPEGAVCGLIGRRERERYVWVAPANQPLQDTLGLEIAFDEDDWAELFAHNVNLVRPEAKDFRLMSAHTLSVERSLMQLSVRRLMILLRKAAIQLGVDFVFETNHEVFREGVRGVLEELLRFLFQRGAFAGRTEADSFRVTTDASVNPPQDVEQGRFVAEIKVAPSQPMEFITVQLTRTGEGRLLAVEA